jgi:hypothetical protein
MPIKNDLQRGLLSMLSYRLRRAQSSISSRLKDPLKVGTYYSIARIGSYGLFVALAFGSALYVLNKGVENELLLNLIANYVFLPIGFALAYLYFRWGRGLLVLNRYRSIALLDPQALLPGSTQNLRRIERDDLYTEVVTELLANQIGVPHVILGAAGAGKTTALQGIVARLAAINMVPVVQPRYSYESLQDFHGFLRSTFLNATDRWLRSDSQGDALWRNLYQSGRIVAIIDGMDDWRARQGIGPSDALYSLEHAARSAGVRVVVALRSEYDALDEPYPSFPLSPLTIDASDIRLRIDSHPIPLSDARVSLFESALTKLDTSVVPLFLELASQVLFDGRLLEEIKNLSTKAAQFTLFNGWLGHQQNSSRARKIDIVEAMDEDLENLEKIAVVMSRLGRLEVANSDLRDAADATSDGHELTRAKLASAQRLGQYLGILDVSADLWEVQQIAFTHSIMQSLMVARYLTRYPGLAVSYASSGASGEMLGGLRFFFSLGSSTISREMVQDRHLELANSRSGASAVSSLRLLSSLGALSLDRQQRLYDRCKQLFPDLPDDLQLKIIEIVSQVPGPSRHETLWQWSIVGRLAVGIRAGRGVMQGGGDSFDQLRQEVISLVERGATVKLHEAASSSWSEFGAKVTMLSVLLPTWADLAKNGPYAAELDRLTALMVEVARQGQIGGVEASIVAGFFGALRRDLNSTSRVYLIGLESAIRTHDARLDLAQMASLILQTEPNASDALLLLRKLNSIEEHPLVRSAARLGLQSAKRSRSSRQREVVWRGGEQSAPRSAARLSDEAHQILADSHLLALLENQYNAGTEVERARRDRSWLVRDLPPCLSDSIDRNELIRGCQPNCVWNLCPLDPGFIACMRAAPFSSAFLAYEARITARTRRPWSPRFLGNDSAAFWSRLDSVFALGRQIE